jgi:hypothetical protein
MNARILITVLVSTLTTTGADSIAQTPVDTTFTYQGRLTENGSPMTGQVNMTFQLWDADVGGNPVGNPVFLEQVEVANGLFAVQLEFDAPGSYVYDGTALWLEITLGGSGDVGEGTTLSPRQQLTATPYASTSLVGLQVPWLGILDMPAGFADQVDDDALTGLACDPGEIPKFDGGNWSCATDETGTSTSWLLTGNAGTTPGTNFLGTTDDQPVELHANGTRALRIEPNAASPNIIGGYNGNLVTGGAHGATIGGGGTLDSENEAGGNFATIGGGSGNTAFGDHATVGGGLQNTATHNQATVGGGGDNQAAGELSTVAGGYTNTASGAAAVVGGGSLNQAAGWGATVPGGEGNWAQGDYSFAGGRSARVRSPAEVGDEDGDEGTFVWSDATGGVFLSSGANQFLIRATGGVGIGTNTPAEQLDVSGTVKMTGFKMLTGASAGDVLTSDASGVGTWQPKDRWSLTGNAGTTPGTDFLGTTDDQPLEIHVNSSRALRIEPDATSPNIIGGSSGNMVTFGAEGATICGGGSSSYGNRITDDYCTVGGGEGNQAGDDAGTSNDADGATVGGGYGNVADGPGATVAGGTYNLAGGAATIGGGVSNSATGTQSTVGGGGANDATADYSAVAGGTGNQATGKCSTVAGGDHNHATDEGAAVAGGWNNVASGDWAIVPGGAFNEAGGDYSFAAGYHAKVSNPQQSGDDDGDEGTFIWADASTDADFQSSGPNQFLIRASNGVGIGTNVLSEQLTVAGNICATGSIGACSDGRFKKNVERITDALATVGKLRGVRFDWRRAAYPDRRFAESGQVGFIAQEVRAVLPEVVSKGRDGYYSVDYGRVVPTLVEAVKELDGEVKAKNAQVAELEKRLARMEGLVAKLTQDQEGGTR